MTYKESYMECNTLKELEEKVRKDIFVAQTMLGNNPDRLRAIKNSAEEVANIKFGENKEAEQKELGE